MLPDLLKDDSSNHPQPTGETVRGRPIAPAGTCQSGDLRYHPRGWDLKREAGCEGEAFGVTCFYPPLFGSVLLFYVASVGVTLENRFMYSVGVHSSNFLKMRLKDDLELKPQSRAMESTV